MLNLPSNEPNLQNFYRTEIKLARERDGRNIRFWKFTLNNFNSLHALWK